MNNSSKPKLTHPCVLRSICAPWIVLLLLLALPAAVQAQFNYTINNGTITTTGYTGPGGVVTIPSSINGLPVTSIGYEAFYNGAAPQPYILTGVTIPDSVTSIGFAAFAWCGSLRSVTLGNGLRSIGDVAFADCGLTTITIPSGVTNIGDAAFTYCALTGVYFLGNAPSLGGPSVFQRDYPIVYYLLGTTGWGPTFGVRPTALWFPPYTYTTNNGTITITGCTGPGSDLTIPSTISGLPVTSIGNSAFAHCTSLTSITIPNSVTSIGDSAFASCYSLTSITIPSSVTDVGNQTFQFCTSLATITLGNSVTSIGGDAFQLCTSLTNVALPNSITNIWGWAFEGCGNLAKVTIGSGVIHIWDGAFQGCTNLTAAYFQGNAPAVAPTAFRGDKLTVYYLPGTTGWGPTFAGQPTALWTEVPTILSPPGSQTAEATSAVGLSVHASSPLPLFYFWYLNATNFLSSGTNWQLNLPDVHGLNRAPTPW